jgi:hypothetical protein
VQAELSIKQLPQTQKNLPSASTNDCYFPLNTDDAGLPADTNTGYVVSGANLATSDSEYYGAGDIRVSKFQMGDLQRSLNGTYNTSTYYWYDNAATYDSTKFEILTQTADSSGNPVTYRIKDLAGEDGSNIDNTDVSNDISSIDTKPYTGTGGLGFEKYKKARASMSKVLRGTGTQTDTDPIYGLHFMNAAISANKLVEAANVRIKKPGTDQTDYENYQMPENSIDFNLRERGFINFFAGTYFPHNNAFFSLHQITRKSTDETQIDTIKEISQIYVSKTDTTADYLYKYADNTYSSTTADVNNYNLKFDMAWVTNTQNLVERAAYYFEIPVNSGEYALGSVSGKNGAYLMYLDISANAQPISRTVITEYVVFTDNQYEYPLGLAVIATTTDTIDPLNSIDVALSASYSGSMTLSKSGTTATMDSEQNGFSPGFVGDNLTLTRTGGDLSVPETVPKGAPKTSYIKRMTYIDYNMVEKAATRTIFTSTDGTMTYSQIDKDGNVTTPKTITNNSGDFFAGG